MTEQQQQTAELTAQALERMRGLEQEIQRAVIGQRQVIQELAIALLAAGHVLIDAVLLKQQPGLALNQDQHKERAN